MKSSQSDRGALLLMATIVLIWGLGWVIMKFLSPYVGSFDVVVIRYALGFASLLVIQLAWRQPLRIPPLGLTLGIAVVDPWHNQSTLVSMLLAIGGGASWGMGTVFSKMLLQRHRNVNVLNLTTWQMFLGTLLALPFTQLIPQPAIVWSPAVVVGLLYLGVMSSAVAWVMWLAVVRRVNATVAGMSGLGVPVFTVVLAWAFLDEMPGALELTGIILMLAGLLVVVLAPQGRRADPVPQVPS
ncbi:DMT family transporter [Eoetvoesiella caeni]|uniref:EamA-like transporter family protein n=1 Tax=Eoetvoesiella caeni TaxID=645616 RepID=A0A366HKP2_9BURK|nr:DMT family transporter [Eoetvoesiella caeni]MCI2807155.1 DMT family transporter [Eoetvoesiella caeni]NYT53448.1 DMT family transporter [Eoetvoesiella caeni]RBP43434.1 EamA-like transporter family protein [Eoetvoesiella caeni]